MWWALVEVWVYHRWCCSASVVIKARCCSCSPYKQIWCCSANGVVGAPRINNAPSRAPWASVPAQLVGNHPQLHWQYNSTVSQEHITHIEAQTQTHPNTNTKQIWLGTIPITNKGNICIKHHWPGDHRHATTNHIPGKEPFVSSISKKSSIGENEQYPLTKLLQDKACRQNLKWKPFGHFSGRYSRSPLSALKDVKS